MKLKLVTSKQKKLKNWQSYRELVVPFLSMGYLKIASENTPAIILITLNATKMRRFFIIKQDQEIPNKSKTPNAFFQSSWQVSYYFSCS